MRALTSACRRSSSGPIPPVLSLQMDKTVPDTRFFSGWTKRFLTPVSSPHPGRTLERSQNNHPGGTEPLRDLGQPTAHRSPPQGRLAHDRPPQGQGGPHHRPPGHPSCSRRARFSFVLEEANSSTVYQEKSDSHYVGGTPIRSAENPWATSHGVLGIDWSSHSKVLTRCKNCEIKGIVHVTVTEEPIVGKKRKKLVQRIPHEFRGRDHEIPPLMSQWPPKTRPPVIGIIDADWLDRQVTTLLAMGVCCTGGPVTLSRCQQQQAPAPVALEKSPAHLDESDRRVGQEDLTTL